MKRHLIWTGVLLLGLQPIAAQAQSCSYVSSSLNYGLIAGNPTPQTDVTGTISVTCSGTVGKTVRVCLGIPAGLGTGSTIADRRMSVGANFVQYQIYKDAARTQIWGLRNQPQTPLKLDIPVVTATGNMGSATMYGRVFAGQTKPVGNYSSSFTGTQRADGRIGYVVTATNPNCDTFAGTRSRFGFSATVGIDSQCTVNADDIDFGTTSSLSAIINGTGNVEATCTTGTTYSIAMDGGTTTGNIANRQMDKLGPGVGTVSYQLYRDAGRTLIWGNGITGTVQTGTGTGALQNIPVYAQVPVQGPQAADDYEDTVTATLTY